MSQTLNAHAFTVGADVFLGGMTRRQDRVETLAHELAHTSEPDRMNSGAIPLRRRVIVAGKPLPGVDFRDPAFWSLFDELTTRQSEHVDARAAEELATATPKRGEHAPEPQDPAWNMFGRVIGAMLMSPEEVQYETMEDFMLDVRTRMGSMRTLEQADETSHIDEGCCHYEPWFALPPKHWEPSQTLGMTNKSPNALFRARTVPSQALKSIFEKRAGSALDCNSMIVASQYKALLDTMGANLFNVVFGAEGLIISQFSERPIEGFGPGAKKFTIPRNVLQQFYDPVVVKATPGNPTANLLPGDWVYFKNSPRYLQCGAGKSAAELAYQGEHSLYAGGQKFLGFGLIGSTEYRDVLKVLEGKTVEQCENTAPCQSDDCKPPGLADASGTTIVYRLNAGRLRAYVMRQFGAAVIRPFTSESATTGAGAGTPED
jgi:hypothetical protein